MAENIEKYRNRFLFLGKNITCGELLQVDSPNKTYISNNVILRNGVSLVTYLYGNEDQKMKIKLGDFSFVGKNVTIEAFNQVIIENDTMIATNVYVSDSQHEYINPNMPIIYQKSKNNYNRLIIKRGSWIGANATVIGNITIGYGSIIGANSFVNTDIPNHCVVGGNPARILKICDYRTEQWVMPKTEKEFMEIIQNRGEFQGYK